MYCRVCGDENQVSFHGPSGQYLCKSCAKDTPHKVSRETFYKKYFGDEDIPESIKREFYEDYQRSTHNLKEYIAKTTSYTM